MNPNPVIITTCFGDDPQWSPVFARWHAHVRALLPHVPVLMATDRPRDPLPGVEQVGVPLPLLPLREGASGRGLLFDRKAWLVLGLLEHLGDRPALYLDHDAEPVRDPFPFLLEGPLASAPLALPPDAGPIPLPILPPCTMRCAGIMWLGTPRPRELRRAFLDAFADLGAGMPFHMLREQAAWSLAAQRLTGDGDRQLGSAFNWVPHLYGPDHGRAYVQHWHGDGKFHRKVAVQPKMTVPA